MNPDKKYKIGKWEISYYDYNGEWSHHIITADCEQAALAKLDNCKTLIEIVQIEPNKLIKP
jgi:hypothetical protein